MHCNKNGTIRIKEHKHAFNSGDVKSKLVCHALEIVHVLNFDKVKVIAPDVNPLTTECFLIFQQ